MKMRKLNKLLLSTIIIFMLYPAINIFAFDDMLDGSIRPYSKNPWYWQYQGEPILLIGASDDDNLFQWTGETLINQLDLLVSVGGNYLRNTMSDRDPGNAYAFKEIRQGVYDLDQWNEDYWNRLKFFLEATAERGIIVQLSLWDHFDISRNPAHPWFNNLNYSNDIIGSRADFYNTVETGNTDGLRYQTNFIDKLLSITFLYDNVLYNINNESSEGEIWENYWAQYINQTAKNLGRKAYVTTMQFDPSTSVRQVMTYHDIYSFIEISQNNQDSRGGKGPAHWDNIMNWRKKIATHSAGPMPMNNEKVYGAGDGVNYSAGTETEAVNRFWRNIFAGCAASRFHRPAETWGTGINKRVQINLKAVKMLLEELDIFSCSPHNDLISHRVTVNSTMEAYVMANLGQQYAVYFPPGRYTINLDPWIYMDSLKVKWLDIDNLTWSEPELVEVEWEGDINDWGKRGSIKLTTPSNRPYVVLLEDVD